MRLTLTLEPIHLLEFEIVCLKLELTKPPHHLPLSGHNSVAATARPLDGEKELERSYYYHLAEEEEETPQGDASMGRGDGITSLISTRNLFGPLCLREGQERSEGSAGRERTSSKKT